MNILNYNKWRLNRSKDSNKRYYHFTRVELKEGDIIKSSVTELESYINIVEPAYRQVAEENGLSWPTGNIGYAHAMDKNQTPIFRISGIIQDDRRKDIEDNIIGYEVIPESEVISGAQSRSPGYCVMMLNFPNLYDDPTEFALSYARDYIEKQTGWDQRDREWICERFVVKSKISNFEIRDMKQP